MKRHRKHTAAEDPGTKRKGFSWKAGLLLVAAVFGFDLLLFFVTDYRVGGFHPCDRLDDRLCHDLGPAGCSVWMYRLNRAESGSMKPAQQHYSRRQSVVLDSLRDSVLGWDPTRSDNPLCYRQLRNYQPLLGNIAALVAQTTWRDALAAPPNPPQAPAP
jgi:hypothetical protein